MKSKIILLVGPTASGKTKISIELAKYYNAEIINADSRYIYKEPLVATAKVTEEEKEGINHHMIDLISLNDDYSIYDYQKEGRKVLDNLLSKNKNVIITGGSGLYIKSLLYDYNLEETNKNIYDFSNMSNQELKDKIDNISDNDIHINNRKRMERFLSYYYDTGNTIINTNNKDNKLYDFVSIGINITRDILYDRINNRVDIMFNNGLLEEAIKLKDFKHFNEIIGYRELIDYFNDKITLEEAKNNIKKDSRHLAKRQMTWFNNQMKDIIWIDINYNKIQETINKIINEIEKATSK